MYLSIFAKPGILPRFADKRSRPSRATFAHRVLIAIGASEPPCAGTGLPPALLRPVAAHGIKVGIVQVNSSLIQSSRSNQD